jgi:hypothetical protein
VNKAILVVGALLALAAPAAAQTTSPADPPTVATLAPKAPPTSSKNLSGVTVTAKKAASDLDQKEVVCHKEAVLGSLFPKQVCATREARAERTRQDRKDLEDSLLYRPLIVH